jgi:hypothetical protein
METLQQKEKIYKLKEKNWKNILSGDTKSNWQEVKIAETSKYV